MLKPKRATEKPFKTSLPKNICIRMVVKCCLKVKFQEPYTSKQFFLDDNLKRIWQVNVNHFRNRNQLPTYLKVTILFDYATSSQSEEIKVIKLSKEQGNIQLFKVDSELKIVLH